MQNKKFAGLPAVHSREIYQNLTVISLKLREFGDKQEMS